MGDGPSAIQGSTTPLCHRSTDTYLLYVPYRPHGNNHPRYDQSVHRQCNSPVEAADAPDAGPCRSGRIVSWTLGALLLAVVSAQFGSGWMAAESAITLFMIWSSTQKGSFITPSLEAAMLSEGLFGIVRSLTPPYSYPPKHPGWVPPCMVTPSMAQPGL